MPANPATARWPIRLSPTSRLPSARGDLAATACTGSRKRAAKLVAAPMGPTAARTCARILARPSSAPGRSGLPAIARQQGQRCSGGGERSPEPGRLREAQRACVQYQAGEMRADAAAGGGRGNSRLHLHPRRHLRRSSHALRASSHHHRSALTRLLLRRPQHHRRVATRGIEANSGLDWGTLHIL